METLINRILIVVLVGTSFLALSNSVLAQTNLSKRDVGGFSWNTFAANRVSNEKWEKSEVATFLDRLTDNSSLPSKVGDFVFADVDADGQLELLATVDYSGRNFFNTLLIVHHDSDSFSLQTIPVWNMESLENRIRDLDNDSHMELILQKQLTPYLGANPVAVWSAVYTLARSEYVDRSADFGLWYQSEIIPRLKQKPTARGRTNSTDEDVSQIELAKIERVVNRNPTAGLELALAWSIDPKAIRRVFAASMLGDIEEKTAEETLQKLVFDSNPDVATNARSVISLKKKPR
jgi:hypothetical protein